MSRLHSALAALVLLAGCASQYGHPFSMGVVDQLVPGRSTEADAVKLLGEPFSVTTNPKNGHRALSWLYSHAVAFSSATGASVSIAFDEHGQMIGVLNQTKL